ncbi:MAG: DoxX family protein [Rhizobacter sp.]|nr:DoxX family protein [Ferruginibacter sp.]
MNTKNIFSWVLRLVAALIMLQTLYFKFSGSPESIYIFSAVGIEPWGRIATGIAELVAAILILIPATVAVGAAMGIGIMTGALLTHLFIIGIEVQDDNGQLFIYALIVLIACTILLVQNRQQLAMWRAVLFSQKNESK